MELDTRRGPLRHGSLMATVTHVSTIGHVAKMLGEDQELLQAIVCNDDNLTYGTIVSVYTGTDEAITALTDDGISEIKNMLAAARRSTKEWHDFLKNFVADPDIIVTVRSRRSAAYRVGQIVSALDGGHYGVLGGSADKTALD